MVEPSSSSTFSYRPAPLATLPRELDPAEYDESPEKRRAQAERLAVRARLKRQYQLQLNDPHSSELIEDPAMLRWTYARTYNIYPNFRPTAKTSLLGALSGLVPIFFWWYVLKADRDRKEKLIQEGKYKRPFGLNS
ncbi:NADH dehydrogenase [ubiquinone] 1 beta subcomplex subunit 4 [Terrapene carolina triunguis]|uniref:NADH dehydrogenase [ubiquinone] 1 beta subcomplex subunit 4 n=1 Tax=Terrapene triunguis TaxID=2587831 RepID=A0A674I9E1_9SAUR|nr:NADH dehydrogenase [ubiquinone] 1 beta subcomplex subunit 4 [Terrapene carolina triunguis]